MIKVYFKANSGIAKLAARVLKTDNCAIVFRKTIYLHRISINEIRHNKALLCHELTHVLQWKKYGMLFFSIKYLWYSAKYGYFQNPFEIEARANEDNELLLQLFILE
jgi:hypothetical protein